MRLLKKERNKQARKREQEREKQTKNQARSKQREKDKQTNQEASKQTLPHVLGFGRYPLSHKPSRPSKREAKKQDLDQTLITQGSHVEGGRTLFLPQM